MFPDLPEHLQTLNSISTSPPSSSLGMTADAEDAFWQFMHTDDLFRNFGSVPSPPQFKQQPQTQAPTPASAAAESKPDPAPTPVSSSDVTTQHQPLDLASFVAAFAQSEQPYTLPLPVPFAADGSSAVKTADVMPHPPPASVASWADSPAPGGEDKPSGAKKLKQLGAAPAEIEEDKRRRNTEASARFRAKKKEREQALEGRAKELEAQVAQLQAEKASLVSENALLKTIVLGASNNTQGAEALAAMLGKRKREE